MSKQESYHPDENQISKAKSTVKRDKPWELWGKARRKWQWSNNEPQWHRMGRYETKEIAEKVIELRERSFGGMMFGAYEYEVRHRDAEG